MQRSEIRGTAIPEKSRKFRHNAATPDYGEQCADTVLRRGM